LEKLRGIFAETELPDETPKETDTIIQTIYSGDKKHQVSIFQRPNGTFGFAEGYFSEDEFEMCWIHDKHGSIFDTFNTAQREVYSRVDWLIGKDIPTESH
jgi:hypothetical protein